MKENRNKNQFEGVYFIKKKCLDDVHIVCELHNGNLIKIMDRNHVPDIMQKEVKIAANEMKINVKCTSNPTHAVVVTFESRVIHVLYRNKKKI